MCAVLSGRKPWCFEDTTNRPEEKLNQRHPFTATGLHRHTTKTKVLLDKTIFRVKSHCPARVCVNHSYTDTHKGSHKCTRNSLHTSTSHTTTNVTGYKCNTHTKNIQSHPESQSSMLMNNIGKHTRLSEALTSQPSAFISPLLAMVYD